MRFSDYIGLARRHSGAVIGCVILGLLIAAALSYLVPSTYQGQASVLIGQPNTGESLLGASSPGLSGQPDRDIQTQIQLMQQRPLLEQVISQVHLDSTPDDLAKRVTVAASGQSNVVTIRATDDDARRAAEIANALALAYVDWSRIQSQKSIKAAADQVALSLKAAGDQMANLRKMISNGDPTGSLAGELRDVSARNAALADKLDQLKVNQQIETGIGAVVAPAAVDNIPIAPKKLLNFALGLVGGLAAGIGLAYLLDHTERASKSDETPDDGKPDESSEDGKSDEASEDGTHEIERPQTRRPRPRKADAASRGPR